MKEELNASLTVKRGSAESVFKKVEDGKNLERKKLVEQLALDESKIKKAIDLMDQQVGKLVGAKKTPRFVYKKL